MYTNISGEMQSLLKKAVQPRNTLKIKSYISDLEAELGNKKKELQQMKADACYSLPDDQNTSSNSPITTGSDEVDYRNSTSCVTETTIDPSANTVNSLDESSNNDEFDYDFNNVKTPVKMISIESENLVQSKSDIFDDSGIFE